MRKESNRVTWEEVGVFAALVAEAWKRTRKNPTDQECDVMLATAREMAATGAVLH